MTRQKKYQYDDLQSFFCKNTHSCIQFDVRIEMEQID